MLELMIKIVAGAVVLIVMAAVFWLKWRTRVWIADVAARGDKRAEQDRLENVPRAELERRANSGTFSKSARHD
jgi:hypothetical protein